MDPPPVDPKSKMQPGLGEEVGAILESMNPKHIFGFHIDMDRYVCWNNSNTMLVSQIQYTAC